MLGIKPGALDLLSVTLTLDHRGGRKNTIYVINYDERNLNERGRDLGLFILIHFYELLAVKLCGALN
jgi:hypothetical protein